MNKVKQLLSDIQVAYSASPNNPVSGSVAVFKMLFWHSVLKRLKGRFVGNYHNMLMLYDTRTDGAAYTYYNPQIEYTLYWLITKIFDRKGMIFFDIGSNIGNFSLLATQRGATVYSFEPNHEIANIQIINACLNDFNSRIFVNEMAVSDKNCKVEFYQHGLGNTGLSSIIDSSQGGAKKIKVPSVTLDSYLSKNQIKKVDLLKIDVEGAEELVFLGAKEALGKGLIKIICWETNFQPTFSKTRKDMANTLQSLGYSNFYIEPAKKIFKAWDEEFTCISIHNSEEKTINNLKRHLKA